MKKKIITLLLASLICVNFTACAGCGSPESETVATVDTETELETETEVIETETTTEASTEGLEATDTATAESTGVPGVDAPELEYEEKYVAFTEIEPATMYAAKNGAIYENPNKFEGQLVVGGSVLVEEKEAGVKFEITHKAEYIGDGENKGKVYYAFKNEFGAYKLIEEDCLTTEPASTEATPQDDSKSETDNTGNTPVADTSAPSESEPETNGAGFTDEEMEAMGFDTGYVEPQQGYDMNDCPEELLDAADGFTLQ